MNDLLILVAVLVLVPQIVVLVLVWVEDGVDAQEGWWGPGSEDPIAFTPTDLGWGFLDEDREVWHA